MATVSIVKATYSDPDIETLLAPLGGMQRFIARDEKVLLKVNLLSSKGPEKAVTTAALHRLQGEAVDLRQELARYEVELITRAFEASHGNRTGAAQLLNMHVRTLSHRMQSLGLNRADLAKK